jgi:hypothetical protein
MSLFRVPIRGWKKCVHEAALFDTSPEFHAANILDSEKSVVWWMRNEPVKVRIPTPAGYLEPDFVYMTVSGGQKKMCLLEVKGEHLWNGPGSAARIKAAGAAAWAKAISDAQLDTIWQFHEVLGQDVKAAMTLGAMLDQAVVRFEAS